MVWAHFEWNESSRIFPTIGLRRRTDLPIYLTSGGSSMEISILTNKGRLKRSTMPAMYLDSSFVIDYWIAERLEGPELPIPPSTFDKIRMTIQDLVKTDRRIVAVGKIREKIVTRGSRVSPVVTALAVLELMKWNAEATFKQYVAEAAGAMHVRRMDEKKTGDYIKKIFSARRQEVKDLKPRKKRKGPFQFENYESTPLEILVGDIWVNTSFARSHGLRGLLPAAIVNFSFPFSKAWQEPGAYACYQMSAADVLHVLFAQHLGCKYIASFDADFVRAKDIIREETGIQVLGSPEEVMKVI